MKVKLNKLYWFIGLLLIANISLAEQVTHTTVKQPQQTATYIQQQAKQWGLSANDYQQYRWLMTHTPSGHWYKQLDPAEVLALNTDDPATMLRYAKVQARNMHVRVNRELKFDQVYRHAYQQLYPHQKPIQSAIPKRTLQSGDRLWLFVKLTSPLGPFVYQRLIQHVQASPGSVLDIYFVGIIREHTTRPR